MTEQTNMNAIMERLAALEAENLALKTRKSSPGKKKAMVKGNKSNGVFITHPKMQAFSDKKGKNYQCGINLQAYQLEAWNFLINDAEMLSMVKEFFKTGREQIKEIA